MAQRPVARVVSRSTFGVLRRPEGRGRSGPIVALFSPLPSPDGRPQVAYAVSKRCGGAVTRNQIRRRLREAASSMSESMPRGAYLIRTDPEAADLDFQEISTHLRGAVEQATKKSKERSDGQ